MVWQPTLYSLLSFAAAGVSATVILLAWRHRFEPAAHAFLGLMLALGGWALIYGIQLGFPTRSTQLGWQRVALIIGGTVPTLWLLFTFQYTGRDDWLTRRSLTILAVDPVMFALLILTNPYHGLIWQRAVFTPVRTSSALKLSFGAGYFVHIAYAYLIVAGGLGLLFLAFVRSNLYRTRTGLLVLGALPPFAANIAFTLGLDWGPLPVVDPTPIVFTLTGVFFGIVQFDLLDRVPVARERALSETADGFVVLDPDEQIVNLNPAARQILGSPSVGQSIWESFPETDDAAPDLDTIAGTTLTTTADGQQRTFDITCSSLSDRHDQVIGTVVSFRDVTARHAYEQRLEVAHRVLRHTLRNRMNVIHGWAEHLATTGPDEFAEPTRRITETAEELIELSEKTQTMVATAGYPDSDPEPVSIRDLIDPLLDGVCHEHPSVTVESDVPSGAAVVVPDPELLQIALRNLVENAIEHNDTDTPQVVVTVELPDDDTKYTQIHVADNGPGIPDMEKMVLDEGTETPLQHGSGLGLWLVYWSVRAAGGDLAFDTNDPRGSIVTLMFSPTNSASAQ